MAVQDKYYFRACAYQRHERLEKARKETRKPFVGAVVFTEEDMAQIQTKATELRQEHLRRKQLSL